MHLAVTSPVAPRVLAQQKRHREGAHRAEHPAAVLAVRREEHPLAVAGLDLDRARVHRRHRVLAGVESVVRRERMPRLRRRNPALLRHGPNVLRDRKAVHDVPAKNVGGGALGEDRGEDLFHLVGGTLRRLRVALLGRLDAERQRREPEHARLQRRGDAVIAEHVVGVERGRVERAAFKCLECGLDVVDAPVGERRDRDVLVDLRVRSTRRCGVGKKVRPRATLAGVGRVLHITSSAWASTLGSCQTRRAMGEGPSRSY